METEIARVYCDKPADNKIGPAAIAAKIQQAGEIIRQGGLVAFPTETVYGLGANGLDAEACRRIYQAKGRPSDNPLIQHIAGPDMLGMVTDKVPELAQQLMTAFMPGPITLIVKRGERVPLSVTGGLNTVGVRMPDNDVARSFIRAAGVPIAAPSANISGRPSPTTAQSVYVDMQGRIPLILDGGPCRFGVESTIVDCTGDHAVILRPGAITKEMLAELAPDVTVDPVILGFAGIPKAPGMKYTHYAPKAPLTLLEGEPAGMAAAFHRELVRRQGQRVGIIASRQVVEQLQYMVPQELLCSYGGQGALNEIAGNIYECLRSFDDLNVDSLLGEGTTDKGLGLAIMNRLHKASGFRSIRF